eukprot:TRINITY_DN107797_c0_g1_i1.p1 TRINITY_DN107797_c0_g1~~TRINITY_DN107797_c0_g1_i1.p1  ORF type:complete len:153 (+),score=10.22 TRINITY_DN107797_c0_g1_i1:47-505(+)
MATWDGCVRCGAVHTTNALLLNGACKMLQGLPVHETIGPVDMVAIAFEDMLPQEPVVLAADQQGMVWRLSEYTYQRIGPLHHVRSWYDDEEEEDLNVTEVYDWYGEKKRHPNKLHYLPIGTSEAPTVHGSFWTTTLAVGIPKPKADPCNSPC